MEYLFVGEGTPPDRWESAALLSSIILHDAQEIRDCQKELLKQKTTSKKLIPTGFG